jgi:hypothetical protein
MCAWRHKWGLPELGRKHMEKRERRDYMTRYHGT